MKIKTYTVGLDDLQSIERVINQLKCAAGSLRPVSKRRQFQDKFDAAAAIWRTDISSVYRAIQLSTDRKFYVYAHCDKSKPIRAGAHPISSFLASLGASFEPFYIGKGTGDRAFNLNRNGLHRKVKQRLSEVGSSVVPVILKDDLTELEAVMAESKLIDILGVSGKAGRLANHDEGVLVEQRRSVYAKELGVLNAYYAQVLTV